MEAELVLGSHGSKSVVASIYYVSRRIIAIVARI